ncbi:MAG: MgtC/SapB family protein [Gammaproteobacteria bacterium]|nr:MgtC/SapB family protein [Gammaproteobacteria bacterium]
MFLGGLVGFEREQLNRPAGFRTHIIVAGAAALLVLLTDVLITHFSVEQYGESLRTDPIRIVEAVVTGVSFLGAGTIFTSGKGHTVKGLTTAAALLLSAAIGIAVALHQYVLAVGTTLLALVVLRLLRNVDASVGGSDADH